MAIRKRNGKYYAEFSYYDANKKRKYKTKSFAKKADATYWLNEIQNEYADYGQNSTNESVFTDFWYNWFENFKKPSLRPITADKWLNSYSIIKKYWGNTLLKDMNKMTYQKYINWYSENHAKTSVEKVHVHTHAAIRYAYEEGYIKRDFALRPTLSGAVGKPDAMKYLEQDDFLKLQKYTDTTANIFNMSRLMIQTACHTGARLSEIAGLTWDDIDVKHNLINIDKTYNYRDGGFAPTKNPQSVRKIECDSKFIKSLNTIIAQEKLRNSKSELLFARPANNTPPTSNAVNKELRKILQDPKLKFSKTITFHGIRHSHISYLLANHVDIQYVSERAGHNSVTTTLNTYAHVLKSMRNSEVKKTIALFS